MRISYLPAVVLCVCLIACANAAEEAKPIGPVEAAKNAGKDVVLQMAVKSSSLRGEICFLNSEVDFKDEKSFTLFIPADAMAKFKAAKIDDPAKYFKGKLVCATGKVVIYHERPEIKLTGPDDLKIVPEEKAKAKVAEKK